MTPGARVAAAIEILDAFIEGAPVEKLLTGWGRRSRFAGSKDRAAVRDHVFDGLRSMQSYVVLGGGDIASPNGRAIMIGALRAQDLDVDAYFTGEGHAPDPVTSDEAEIAPESDIANMPAWLSEYATQQLGADAAQTYTQALRQRAPVTIRVNSAKTTRDELQDILSNLNIPTCSNPLAPNALTLDAPNRQLVQTEAYHDGLFDLQDASSQAVVASLPKSKRILDYCAGGGGKTLALAADPKAHVTAYDAAPERMKDLAARAKRAGANVTITTHHESLKQGAYDLVLLDAPCSGSGAWRRNPEGKWRYSHAQMEELTGLQAQILNDAAPLVASGGILAYATCSVFPQENDAQTKAFLHANSEWKLVEQSRWAVDAQGDGFYLAQMRAP